MKENNEINSLSTKENKSNIAKINLFLIIAIFGVLLFNQFQLSGVNKADITGATIGTSSPTSASSSDTINLEAALKEITPRGIPDVYGGELGVSYDDVVKSMSILNQYDDLDGPEGRGSKKIVLSSEMQQRYNKVTSMIGCEFCCGAQTLTTKSGEPACGCAHSGAMRGLAKYLLQKYPEISDEQILNELVKWKTLFFPKDMAQKYLASKGVKVSTTSLPSQVGGC